MILAVKLLMALATALFVAGYRVARSNNLLHRRLMISGLVVFVGIAAVLVAGVHLFGEGYAAAPWLVRSIGAKSAGGLLIAHRFVAITSALFLFAQAWSGWRRRPAHLRLARTTMLLWLISFVSGCLLFV